MATEVLVMGDIHGNRPALEAVLDSVGLVDQIICTGDVIGLNGWNDWCVEAIREIADTVVLGNHDARVRSDFRWVPSFPSAHEEMSVVTEQLDSTHVEWIDSLPFRVETDEYVVGHARPFYQRDPGHPCHGFAQDDYGTSAGSFTTIGPMLDEGQAAFLGHTHEQHAVDTSRFCGQHGLVLNPGAVGEMWSTGVADYALVDLDTLDHDLRSVDYDHMIVADRFEELGVDPQIYASETL